MRTRLRVVRIPEAMSVAAFAERTGSIGNERGLYVGTRTAAAWAWAGVTAAIREGYVSQ